MSFGHLFQKSIQNRYSNILSDVNGVLKDKRSKKIFGLILFTGICIELTNKSCYSSNSIALHSFSTLIWIDLISLFISLLGLWVEQKKPTKLFTFGYVRCELLVVFTITVLAILSSILGISGILFSWIHHPFVQPSSVIRVTNATADHLLPGLIVCVTCHLMVSYFNTSQALDHVISFSNSNFLQDQMNKISRSLCKIIPGLSALLLPRINPFALFCMLGATLLVADDILLDAYETNVGDTAISLIICCAMIITMWPLCSYTSKIFLQTAPVHMITHLDKCLREASTLDGVLEFRHEHFWTLGFGNLVGSLHVRVRRDANEQLVLQHLNSRLSNLVSDLTIQVFKDEWAWNPSVRYLHKDQSKLVKYSQGANDLALNSTSFTPSKSSLNSSSSSSQLNSVVIQGDEPPRSITSLNNDPGDWVQTV